MFKFIDVRFKNILNLPTLCIERERITTIVGASGSGKTTILRMLNKMLSPTQGRILFNDIDLSQVNSVAHRRNVTMLSQTPTVFAGNIRDNLNVGLKFQDRNLASDDELLAMLEQVQLKKKLDGSANILSGGEKQRLALARVLLLNSEVILLDEPSAALDDETEETIIQMVTKYAREQKKTIIMVTHSKGIAQQYSDTIIEISQGRWCQLGVKHEWNR